MELKSSVQERARALVENHPDLAEKLEAEAKAKDDGKRVALAKELQATLAARPRELEPMIAAVRKAQAERDAALATYRATQARMADACAVAEAARAASERREGQQRNDLMAIAPERINFMTRVLWALEQETLRAEKFVWRTIVDPASGEASQRCETNMDQIQPILKWLKQQRAEAEDWLTSADSAARTEARCNALLDQARERLGGLVDVALTMRRVAGGTYSRH